MNVKVYYSAYRNADGAALFYMDEERRGEYADGIEEPEVEPDVVADDLVGLADNLAEDAGA